MSRSTYPTTSTTGGDRDYERRERERLNVDDRDSQHHGRWTAASEVRDLTGSSSSNFDRDNRRSSSDRDFNRERDSHRDSSRGDRDSRRYNRDDDYSSSRGFSQGSSPFGLGHDSYGSSSYGHPSSYGSSAYGHPSSYGSSAYGHPSSFGSSAFSHPSSYGSSAYGSSAYGHPASYDSSFPLHSSYPHSALYGSGYDHPSSYGSSAFGSFPHQYSSGFPAHQGSSFGQHYGGQFGQQYGGYGDHQMLGQSSRSSRSLGSSGAHRPEVDIYEVGNEYIIEMDLPGHSRDHIETKLYGNDLVITSRPPRREHNFHMNERSLGQREVSRRLVLPSTADSTKINAALTNGVLRINIPRTAVGQQPITAVVLPSTSTSALQQQVAPVHPKTVVTTDTTTTTTDTHRAL